VLVNAAHIKAISRRKTDVKDAEWIAQLLECGLLRPSFVPPPDIRRLRMLTRYRVQLMADRTREITRLELMLEDGLGKALLGGGQPDQRLRANRRRTAPLSDSDAVLDIASDTLSEHPTSSCAPSQLGACRARRGLIRTTTGPTRVSRSAMGSAYPGQLGDRSP
jgi:transposase